MKIYSIEEIKNIVARVASNYQIVSVYLFGSYARGEATENSDLDFIVEWKEGTRRTLIYAFAEDLQIAFGKEVDVFEIHELNPGTEFESSVLRDRMKVA